MNIAVIGNRKGWTYEEVENTLLKEERITPSDTIITGGAEGVDAFAERFAKKHGIKLMLIYPDRRSPSPQRYYERNKKIADECDCMIAFNKGNNHRSGSFNAINQTKSLGKDVLIISENAHCPKCGSINIGSIEFKENGDDMQCCDCGNEWFEERVEYG